MASTRVVLNRAALGEVSLGVADGLAELCQEILDTAQVPDAPPFGEGLVDKGAFGIWWNGKKIAGTATKPRGAKADKDGITAVIGYGFPGRFQEMGTIHQPARPFLTPASLAVLPRGAPVVKRAVKRRMG